MENGGGRGGGGSATPLISQFALNLYFLILGMKFHPASFALVEVSVPHPDQPPCYSTLPVTVHSLLQYTPRYSTLVTQISLPVTVHLSHRSASLLQYTCHTDQPPCYSTLVTQISLPVTVHLSHWPAES